MTAYSTYISKDFPIEGSFLRLDDKEKAWEEIDGRMRTAVRKAQKAGATIVKAKGTKTELDAFRAFCLNPDDMPPEMTDRYHLYLAYIAEEMVAGILVVEVNTKLFMLCHASTPKAKQENIPSLLIWHVVEQFTGSKFARLDIGASYRPSLQSFFSGWKTQGYPMIMRPPELKPTLMLTPFDTQAMEVPMAPDARNQATKILEQKFGGKPFTFFPRAMYAIFTLIKWLKNEGKIPADGNITILTTTETHYISSCVTSAIEQTCPVTRELNYKTAAIFVIHEFGFPHPRLTELRKEADKRGVPLIEDCAYGWNTKGIGQVGDYAIYSLTKAFPVQFGGYLVGKYFTPEELWHGYGCSDEGKKDFVKKRLAHWLQFQDEATAKRRENYAWYTKIFGEDRTYFPLAKGIEPGGFMLEMENEAKMIEAAEFVRGFGIEIASYWKNGAMMLPVHQRLSPAHLEYIAGAVLATEREWCGVPGKHH
jgi:hypothetical protein